MATAFSTIGKTAMAGELSPPSKLLALAEFPRALFELGSLPLAAPVLASAPKGDGHPVLVIPGFMASDTSTATLRRFLNRKGYDTRKWELGRNLGPKTVGLEAENLLAKIDAIHDETGQKVSLVGWSLGGVMARQIARWRQDKVRQVVSMGSPFAGNPRATTVWRLYERLTGQKIDDPRTQEQLADSELAPPVPSTAIYSKSDGIVAWQLCQEPAAKHTQNIRVYGSHCGLGVNAAALYVVADRLAQAEDAWAPFERGGLRDLVYPVQDQ